MSGSSSSFTLLLAAHGERRGGGENASVTALAGELRDTGAVDVRCGFLKGAPSIREAVHASGTHRLVVYPLFLSDGYFTRSLLPRHLIDAGACSAERPTLVLPPLGCDDGLASLVADNARLSARAHGFVEAGTTLLLLAHGSRTNDASRRATRQLANAITGLQVFRELALAFLEEPPSFEDALSSLPGPVVVCGLFAGEGLHGGEDMQRLLAESGREDIVFAGNVGGYRGLAALISAAVARGRAQDAHPMTAHLTTQQHHDPG